MILYNSMGTIFVAFHLILFFFAALVCHMALSSSKPSAERLTEFYLIMSIGGALGGVFNALITPNIFTMPLEYALALGLAACMRFTNQKQEKPPLIHIILGIASIIAFPFALQMESMVIKVLLAFVVLLGLGLTLNKRWVFGITVTLLLLISPLGGFLNYINSDTIYQDRNFFGVMRVLDTEDNIRLFSHGTTIHGSQSLDEKYKLTPLSYYWPSSPIGDMFEFISQEKGKQKVAVLGLGIGVTACFYKKDRSFDFFEIDPGVIHIAENPEYFTFLSDCGSPYNIIQGDARLTLSNKKDYRYDFILADAYSSDNIPVHLITLEAVELYLQKLKPKGMLGFNISSRYLDIEPVLAEISDSLGFQGYSKVGKVGKAEAIAGKNHVHAFVLARNVQQEKFLQENGWTPAKKRKGVGLWADQFSNIISAFGTKSLRSRMEEIELKEKNNQEN